MFFNKQNRKKSVCTYLNNSLVFDSNNEIHLCPYKKFSKVIENYNGIWLDTDKIEKSKLCVVEIYIRGKKINEPKMVYSSEIKDEINPTARIALEQYRNTEYNKTEKTAKARIEKIKREFILRNASREEIQGVEKLEEYINKKEKNR